MLFGLQMHKQADCFQNRLITSVMNIFESPILNYDLEQLELLNYGINLVNRCSFDHKQINRL